MRWSRLIPDRVGNAGAPYIYVSPDALGVGLNRPVNPGECGSRRRSNASDEIALDAIRHPWLANARRVSKYSEASEGVTKGLRNGEQEARGRRCVGQGQVKRAGEV
jgi:hypothetical protein